MDSNASGLHAFVEGHDDCVFYVGFLDARIAAATDLFMYECGKKDEVYRAFDLVAKDPRDAETLFFVDKDLSDLLGETYRASPEIFVTTWYSVENYLVTRDLLKRAIRDLIRINGIVVDTDSILDHFENQLERFHGMMRVPTAWALYHLEAGRRPIINNINLSYLLTFNEDGELVKQSVGRARRRLAYLDRTCDVSTPTGSSPRIREISRTLEALPSKQWLRGKFEAWFFIKYLEMAVKNLRTVAREAGGNATMRTAIHEANFVEVLAPRLNEPDDLCEFLNHHIP
jgi:hypothetical protein